MISDDLIAGHYGQPDLVTGIRRGLTESGISISSVTIDDLAVVDEFHVGGRAATESFLAGLELEPEMHVLDVGCGLGGPARFGASRYDCRVTGIDLTPSFIEAAQVLTDWVGLSDRVAFENCAAQDMTFPKRTFDAAYLLHVGMNVADKTGLFAAIAKVLKPGAKLGVYDLMRTDTGDLTFPVPWASTSATSLVATQSSYEASLVDAGFDLVSVRDRHEVAAAFVSMIRSQDNVAAQPPPLGLHLLIGSDGPTKLANVVAALDAGILSPIEIVATRRQRGGAGPGARLRPASFDE
ncbi:MAG: methyltransferase domain-containing protein [Acidimicrobiia bacterium]|nr:methyltransferase domain-containing protein [Acidimicrobiia bacterium]